MTIQDQLTALMRAKTTAKLVYQDKSGVIIYREVEPYSFSPDGQKLFGFCLRDQHIKQFKLEKLIRVENGSVFVPRQEIKVPGEPPMPAERVLEVKPYTPSKKISDAKAPWEDR